MDNQETTPNEKYILAKQQVEQEKGFYSHLATYILVNLLLVIMYWWKGDGFHWYVWPLFGWGFAIALHAYRVFGKGVWLGDKWEQRRIRKLMDED